MFHSVSVILFVAAIHFSFFTSRLSIFNFVITENSVNGTTKTLSGAPKLRISSAHVKFNV